MDSSEAHEAIARAVDGDADALARLIRQVEPSLTERAVSLMGDRLRAATRASDLVQTSLLRACDSIPEFRGSTLGEFEGWTARVLENTVRDQAKFLAAKKRAFEQQQPLDEGGEPVAPQRSPVSELVAVDETVQLHRALRRLPPHYQRLLQLHMQPGFTHAAAAEALERSEGACRVLLARARAALRVELERGPGDTDVG